MSRCLQRYGEVLSIEFTTCLDNKNDEHAASLVALKTDNLYYFEKSSRVYEMVIVIDDSLATLLPCKDDFNGVSLVG